jgi:hypothetical protein
LTVYKSPISNQQEVDQKLAYEVAKIICEPYQVSKISLTHNYLIRIFNPPQSEFLSILCSIPIQKRPIKAGWSKITASRGCGLTAQRRKIWRKEKST